MDLLRLLMAVGFVIFEILLCHLNIFLKNFR